MATLENNVKIRPEPDRESAFAGTSGGGRFPPALALDNGAEPTRMAVLKWRQEKGGEWNYVAPVKPTQNVFVESFIGRSTTSF